MKILPGTYAVFWTRPGYGRAFHADMAATGAREAVEAFRALFPTDLVQSVRDASGRFQAFNAE